MAKGFGANTSREDIEEIKVFEEVDKYYMGNKENSDYSRFYQVIADKPYHLSMVRFYKKPEGSMEEKEISRLYFSWDGSKIRSYTESYRWLQDFIRHSQERRVRSWWNFFTSPLTIGGLIGLLLVMIVAAQLIRNRDVPHELWQILTAVIAFYFGRGSTGSGDNSDVN